MPSAIALKLIALQKMIEDGYDSSGISSDEDGSVLERLEWLQQNFKRAICDTGMVASRTTIVSADLAGYGDSNFILGWKMGCLRNADNPGNAPENEWVDITAYTSATGTFTLAGTGFSVNVEEGDEIIVARDELVVAFQRTGRIVVPLTFESEVTQKVTITGASQSLNLASCVVHDLPDDITLEYVKAYLVVSRARDTSGVDNAINNANMALKVDADPAYGSTVTAALVPDNSLAVDVSTSADLSGAVFPPANHDVKTEIVGNGTYYGRLENAQADGANLELHEVYWIIKVTYLL